MWRCVLLPGARRGSRLLLNSAGPVWNQPAPESLQTVQPPNSLISCKTTGWRCSVDSSAALGAFSIICMCGNLWWFGKRWKKSIFNKSAIAGESTGRRNYRPAFRSGAAEVFAFMRTPGRKKVDVPKQLILALCWCYGEKLTLINARERGWSFVNTIWLNRILPAGGSLSAWWKYQNKSTPLLRAWVYYPFPQVKQMEERFASPLLRPGYQEFVHNNYVIPFTHRRLPTCFECIITMACFQVSFHHLGCPK